MEAGRVLVLGTAAPHHAARRAANYEERGGNSPNKARRAISAGLGTSGRAILPHSDVRLLRNLIYHQRLCRGGEASNFT